MSARGVQGIPYQALGALPEGQSSSNQGRVTRAALGQIGREGPVRTVTILVEEDPRFLDKRLVDFFMQYFVAQSEGPPIDLSSHDLAENATAIRKYLRDSSTPKYRLDATTLEKIFHAPDRYWTKDLPIEATLFECTPEAILCILDNLARNTPPFVKQAPPGSVYLFIRFLNDPHIRSTLDRSNSRDNAPFRLCRAASKGDKTSVETALILTRRHALEVPHVQLAALCAQNANFTDIADWLQEKSRSCRLQIDSYFGQRPRLYGLLSRAIPVCAIAAMVSAIAFGIIWVNSVSRE
jgi:hypothetical protein